MKTIINLEANNAYEKAVLTYLQENASETLIEKINAGSKTLEQCFGYIREQAQKQQTNGCAMIEDKVVYGWAIHFFEEDDIKCESHPKASKPTSAPKQTAKSIKPADNKGEEQLSLFSLL